MIGAENLLAAPGVTDVVTNPSIASGLGAALGTGGLSASSSASLEGDVKSGDKRFDTGLSADFNTSFGNSGGSSKVLIAFGISAVVILAIAFVGFRSK